MKIRFKISCPNILNNIEEAIKKYWEEVPILSPETEKEQLDKLLEFRSIASEWTNGGKEITIEIDLKENNARIIHESENL